MPAPADQSHQPTHGPRSCDGCRRVLSAGGGSFPYLEYLGAVELLKHSKAVPLIDSSELADGARIALVAVVGAPLPMFERFVDPDHFVRPVRVLESYLGERFTAVMGFEIGSMNGIIPVMVAAKMGLPLVDADTVGPLVSGASHDNVCVGWGRADTAGSL